MREIKFRGLTSDGKWVYGDLEAHRHDNKVIIHTYSDDGRYYRYFEVNPETVGQFTSLKDKYGKEIYEGDIITFDCLEERGCIEVRFVRGVFAFLWNGDVDDECVTQAPTREWAEVTGNVHESLFKVGDCVVIVACPMHPKYVGKKGRIEKVKCGNYFKVSCRGKMIPDYATPDCLKKLEE